jgi:hypothetical protein
VVLIGRVFAEYVAAANAAPSILGDAKAVSR